MKMNWLYSMRLAFVLLVSVSIWFGFGVLLHSDKAAKQCFRMLNELPMMQWWDVLANNSLVALWMIGLFGLMILLGVNTALCSWRDLLPVWRQKRWRSPRIVMLPIHLLTLAVFLFHGIDLVFIHGHDKAVLQQGESFQSGQYTVQVKQITYLDDKNLITEDEHGDTKAGRITRRSVDVFDPRHNTIELQVNQNETQAYGIAGFMNPYSLNGFYVMVTDFKVLYNQEDKGVQVELIAVHNPLANYFFASYVLLLLSLLYQTYFFWQRNCRKGIRR